MDRVALLKQELGEIGAVLPRRAGDEGHLADPGLIHETPRCSRRRDLSVVIVSMRLRRQHAQVQHTHTGKFGAGGSSMRRSDN